MGPELPRSNPEGPKNEKDVKKRPGDALAGRDEASEESRKKDKKKKKSRRRSSSSVTRESAEPSNRKKAR